MPDEPRPDETPPLDAAGPQPAAEEPADDSADRVAADGNGPAGDNPADSRTAVTAEPTDSDDAAVAERVPALLGSKTVDVSPEDAVPYDTPELGQAAPARGANIDLLDDVQLDVKIELGRTSLYIDDVLKLGVGSVVELNKLAGDPVDIYVNERLIARGEVLVLNDNFCVRISDIHCPVPELEGTN